MFIIYIKTLYMSSKYLTTCQLFKWSHFFVKFGFTAPVFFLIPGSCDRFPGQKTPVPGRENRFPDFWIWSAISSGFWRFSPGTGRFPVPGLRRENASRRKRKPWGQLEAVSACALPSAASPRRLGAFFCMHVTSSLGLLFWTSDRPEPDRSRV